MCVFKLFERFRRRVRRFFWWENANYSTVLTRQSPVFGDELLQNTHEKYRRFRGKLNSFLRISALFFEWVLRRTQPVFRRNWRCFQRNEAARSAQFDRWAMHLRLLARAICKLLLLIKMLRNFRTSVPTTAAFFWWFCAHISVFSLHLAALHAIETTESVQILIGKIYLSVLLWQKKDGGMCPARVAKRALHEQKTHSAVSFFEYSWLGLMQFNCGVLPRLDAPQSRKAEKIWEWTEHSPTFLSVKIRYEFWLSF